MAVTVAMGTRIQPDPLATEAPVVTVASSATVVTVETVETAKSLASVAPEATAVHSVEMVETAVTAVTQQSLQRGQLRLAARAARAAMPPWVMVALVEPVGRRRFRVLALRAKVVPVVMVGSQLKATAEPVVSVVLPMVSAQT